MAGKSPSLNLETKLNMDRTDNEKSDISQDDLIAFSERAKALIDVDIKEPDSMARDLLMYRYTNHKPNFKDFGEAVNFIMNTQEYTERIENLVKYERILFFKQRPDLENTSSSRQSSPNQHRNHNNGRNSRNDIDHIMYSNPNQIIYGQNLLLVLEKIVDAVDSKVCGETDDDYDFRRQQAAIEFVTSFHHLRCYQHESEEDNDITDHPFIDQFLAKSFKEGGVLMQQKNYKGAISKYLDCAFACTTKSRQDDEKFINILKPFLENSSDEESSNAQPNLRLSASEIDGHPTSDNVEMMSQNDSNSNGSSSEETDYEEEEDQEEVAPDFMLLECKVRLIETLLKDKQLKRASRYANYLMRWMCQKEFNGYRGYYAINYTDKYSLLQSYFGEAECQLGNSKLAISGCTSAIEQYIDLGHNLVNFETNMFAVRKNFFERLVDEWDVSSSLNIDRKLDCDTLCPEIETYRTQAKIIVDVNREKGMINGKTQFVVNDIDSALRIAKDSDKIFLEEGTYIGKQVGKKKDGSEERMIEVLKNVEIIGCHTSRVRLVGSIVKRSHGKVTFRNITFQVGKDQGSGESIYAMSGTTQMIDCCIKTPANTAIHVISDNPGKRTILELDFCVIDGMNYCERILSFEGFCPVISVKNCYVSDSLSFCVVLAPELKCSVNMTVLNSLFIHVQDGIKIILHHESPGPPIVQICGCHFELSAYRTEDGSPSIAFCQTAGIANLENNYINMLSHDVPSTGFSLHSLQSAKLTMNMIKSTAEVPRQFSISKGIMITECLKTEIQSTEINGMRVGIELANKIDHEVNSIKIQDCFIKCCSLGLLMSDSWNQGEGVQQNKSSKSKSSPRSEDDSNSAGDTQQPNEEGNILVTNPSKLFDLLSKQKDEYIVPNIFLKLTGCLFDTSYYGVMNETGKGQICLSQNTFQNIPKAVLLNHSCLDTDKVELCLNEFQLTEAFDCTNTNFNDPKEVENLRRTLYIHFSLYENLSHRIAYDGKGYFVISSHHDQMFLFENKLASSFPSNSDEDQEKEIPDSESNYKRMV